MKTTATVAALLLSLAACKGKDKEPGPAADPGGKPAKGEDKPVDAGKWPPEFAAWDIAARQKAWEGAWAGDYASLGDKAAWEIKGTRINLVHGKGEKQLELELESPCSARFVEKREDGKSSTTSTFTLKDGALITGLGSAGSRKGDTAIACGSGRIFTLDAKGCTEWEDRFGKLSSKPGECGFRKDGDTEVFHYTAYGSESTMLVEGDVLWTDQLKRVHAQKHPDFAAAKAAQGL
jgi:hypothetical protein